MGSHTVGHDWRDWTCMHALEKAMAPYSSVLAWRVPGTGEPGGLLSMGSHRVGHDWSDLAGAAAGCISLSSSHHLLPLLCPQVGFVSLCLYSRPTNRFINTIFSKFHISVIICDICFSLSDLFHSGWQALGSPTSLQVAHFSFLFYGCVIFHCTHVPHLLCPFKCRWTFSVASRSISNISTVK